MSRLLVSPDNNTKIYYRHFKGKWYEILHTAKHHELDEFFVVYQALYEDRQIYIRPLKEFLSRTDKEKHPYAKQNYRFMNTKELNAQFGANKVINMMNEEIR